MFSKPYFFNPMLKCASVTDQQTVVNNDSSKRQRKWNSEGLKISEPQSGEVLSTTPKEAFQPAFKRSFSRSDSSVGEEAPKERVGESVHLILCCGLTVKLPKVP